MSDRHLTSIRQFAHEGGLLALDHFQRLEELEISEKSRNDLVSNADRGVELLLREAIMRDFPDDGILGEEYGHEPGPSGITWVIDPIDGTANFVRGRPHWCVSIARLKGNEIIAGCVYDPVHDELYLAGKHTASTRNGQPIRVTAVDEIDRATVGIGLKPSKGDSRAFPCLPRWSRPAPASTAIPPARCRLPMWRTGVSTPMSSGICIPGIFSPAH